MTGWDRTPRSGVKARIHTNATPDVFKNHILDVLNVIKDKQDKNKIVCLW